MIPESTRSECRPGTPQSLILHVLLLIFVMGSALLLLYASQDILENPFRNTMDATIYAQAGFRLNNPELYQNDPVIPLRTRDFPTVFYALLPDSWESLQNVGTTYVCLGLVFGVLFGVGVYLFIEEVFQRHDVALLVATIAMLVDRALMQTPGGWGARLITPRYTVLGLSPFLLWLYWRWRRSWKVTFVFLVLGIFLLIHPRFSVYPATLMAIGMLMQKKASARHWWGVAVRVAPFIPFLLYVLGLAFSRLEPTALTAEPGTPVELTAYDFPGGLLRQLFFSATDAAVPAALALLGCLRRRHSEDINADEREAFITFTVLPAAIYGMFWTAIQWFPLLKQLNIKRYLTWAYLLPYAWATYWLIDQWQRGDLRSRATAAIAAVALVTVTYGGIRSTLLSDSTAYQWLVDWTYDTFASDAVQKGHEVILADAAAADPIENDWESFYALCDWARANTDRQDVFVIPPRGFSVFRLYSQRSLYAMAKNVGIGALYDADGDSLWQRYEAATGAYVTGTSEAFHELTEDSRADYAVVERDKLTLDLPLVYENQRYLVYSLSQGRSGQ